jgi:hypothetical protein
VRAKRERVDEDDEEMDIDDDDDEAGPSAPTTSNSTSVLSCCTQLINRSYIIIFDRLFSTSAAIQQVALFKPPAGGHKWCLGSTISTVRLMAYTASQVVPNEYFRYRGFQTAQVKPSTKPNGPGDKVKTAEVVFENAQLAAAAKQMLDGFQLKKGWNMAVTFLP